LDRSANEHQALSSVDQRKPVAASLLQFWKLLMSCFNSQHKVYYNYDLLSKHTPKPGIPAFETDYFLMGTCRRRSGMHRRMTGSQ